MASRFTVRKCREADFNAVLQLYPLAFPEEDLSPLVRQLLDHEGVNHWVCERKGETTGHVAFTSCEISGHTEGAALLGPLTVHPEHQNAGVGSALVNSVLEAMKELGVAVVLVLGDPAYYGRFGFKAESGIAAPYDLPDEWREAWQSFPLSNKPKLAGKLMVPKPWLAEALWLP